jgi:hypothetical protein
VYDHSLVHSLGNKIIILNILEYMNDTVIWILKRKTKEKEGQEEKEDR